LIKSVSILSRNIKISRTKRLASSDHGSFDEAKGLIKIKPQSDEHFEKKVLIHEISHAYESATQALTNFTEQQVEQICNFNEIVILDLIKNNPHIIEYIKE
jgi:hypothetical protein